MKRIKLADNERKVLHTLAQHGAMSPGQVSAETWMMPGETLSLLRVMSDEGLVLMRGDTNSPDGMFVAISSEARHYING
jgi:hypothetical protein